MAFGRMGSLGRGFGRLGAHLGSAAGSAAPAPAYGTLTITSSIIDNTPDWVLYGDFQTGDVIQFERQTAGAGWASPEIATHTVTSGELAGVSGSLGMSALANGDYEARFKYHRAGSTNWSPYSDTGNGIPDTAVAFTISVPTAAYTYQGSGTTVSGSNTADFTIDIGSAASDKYLLFSIDIIGNTQTITSLTIDPAGSPLATAQLLFYNPSNTIAFYGVAAPGISGSKTVRLITTGASFVERNIFCYSLTGLNAQSVKNSKTSSSGTTMLITADPGDLLFLRASVNSARNWNSSSETPAGQATIGTTGKEANWTVAGSYPSNSFSMIGSSPVLQAAVSFK